MTWRKRTIMEMAREAGELNCDCCLPYYEETDIEGFEGFLKRFAKLVREDERNRTWTQEHWTEYERNIAAAEREECAKLLEEAAKAAKNADPQGFVWQAVKASAEVIRERSKDKK